MAFALAVAALHAAAVVLLLTGALLALRDRRVLLLHAPVAAVIAAVHVAGTDCPLTTWERALRARAGQPYRGGFLDHYVFGPLQLDTGEPAVQLGVYAIVLLPNLLGYALLAARTRRDASASPARVAPRHHAALDRRAVDQELALREPPVEAEPSRSTTPGICQPLRCYLATRRAAGLEAPPEPVSVAGRGRRSERHQP